LFPRFELRQTREMDRPGARRSLSVLFAVLLAALPVAIVGAVRGLPPVVLAESGVAWLPTAFTVVLAALAALAALPTLVTGLRRASLSALLASGSSATLAGGAVSVLAGADSLAAPVLGAAALGLAAWLTAGRVVRGGTAAQVGAAVAVMLAAEALALLAILAPARSLAPFLAPILVAAIGLALATIVAAGGRRGAAAGLLAAGAAGLLADRGGSLEGLIGMASLAAGQLLALADGLEATPEVEPADDRLPELARRLADAVLRFDGHLRLRDWNHPAAGLLGLDSGSIGMRIEDLLGVSVADLPGPEGVSVTHGGVGGLEVAMHRSGSGVIAVIRDPGAAPETDRLGNELRTTIEELLRARRTIELQRGELERSAMVDPLTGVASRGAILDRLRIEVAQARRYRHPLAVVLLDVDRFGEINRLHGVSGGDSVLREVALRIRLRVREADALGRAGSDGFLAALPHTDEAGAATFADALRHRLALRPMAIGTDAVVVTVSIGVATMRPGEELDLDGLLARVQEALDSARAAGGNRIALDRLHGLARLEDPHQADEPESDRAAE
jgi:diguanylate cyclase (GGDEF)-like protein